MGKSYAAWKAATYFPQHQSYLSMFVTIVVPAAEVHTMHSDLLQAKSGL